MKVIFVFFIKDYVKIMEVHKVKVSMEVHENQSSRRKYSWRKKPKVRHTHPLIGPV